MTATPDPCGSALTAPPLPRPHFFGQGWTDLTFVHWPVHPESVAALFPPGTRPDVFADGMTYAALVPFAMRGLGVRASRSVPYFGTFLETNVWLYSVDDDGRRGIVCLASPVARLAVVPFGRLTGYPHRWARMRMTRSGDHITYSSQGRWPRRGPRSMLTVRVLEEAEPTLLEIWLTARWGSHVRVGGRTWWIPTAHEPWPLRAAQVVHLEDELMDACGIPLAGAPLRVLFSPGVRARYGRPALVRHGATR